ncbi:MAG: glycosyltransferase family 4 protein [Magnetovibrio sp.]|nr:glycosyltransferase family 4 protein [Magnetovibrio sp.]
MTYEKKLTYVSPEPERQGHASYTHVHEIIDGLVELGWDVDLFCPRYGEAKLPGALSRLLGISKTLLKVMTAPRPKVYYMRWHFAVFPLALFAKILGIPTVIEVNGPVDDLFIAWPITRKFKSFFTWLMQSQLRWSDGVVAVTGGLAETVRDITDQDKLIVVIPNGANTNQFTPQAAEAVNATIHMLPESFMIFFGTMAPWQGIGTVLAALEDPAWPKSMHAVFAGDGAERPAVEALAQRLDHVHYLGRVPYDELPSVVARAQGSFVCSENLEGRASTGLAPLKLFESMACGLPIISTNMPFQADVVRDGGCGYVIEAGNAQVLAETVVKLMNNPVEAGEMSKRSRAIAVKDHSWAARAKDTQTVLQRVLKG